MAPAWYGADCDGNGVLDAFDYLRFQGLFDAGNEDAVEGDALYRDILALFLRRIRERSRAPVP